MLTRLMMPKLASSTLIFALVSTLIVFIPVERAAAAPLDITTYPQQRVGDLREVETLTAASYSNPRITFTTGTKNLFAYEKEVGGTWGMYIQITGMVNSGAGCNRTQNVNDPIKYDGYNSPIDSVTVTSISASAGVVTYNVAKTGEIQVGEEVTISGAANAGFNGTFKVNTVTSDSRFTVISSATGTSSTANARHVRWEKIISSTDTTVTIARDPGSGCTATTTASSLAVGRENGPNINAMEKSSNMASDASGSLIFMSTGASWPAAYDAKGYLYISRNSGVSWNKVDLVDASGVSIGNTGIQNLSQDVGTAPYQFETLYGCQRRACAWSSVSVSHDGMTLAAASYRGELVFSRDGGYTWTELSREHQKRCNLDGTGVNWQEIRVTKDGKKIIAYDSNMGNLMTLDLTQAYSINLSAKPPSNLKAANYGAQFAPCEQSFYSTTTNPSFFSTHSTDKARIPAEFRDRSNLYTMAIDKTGSRIILSFGFNSTVVCTGSGNQWTKCTIPAAPTYSTGPAITGGFASIDIRASFMSASGRYITLAGYASYIVRSVDYGATFQIVSDQARNASTGKNTNTPGSTSAGLSVCGDPTGAGSIAGSDDGKVQYFVTRNTSFATYGGGTPALTPGICKSTNYGAKGSWSPVPVALFAGSAVDISRKQLFTTVVVGSTGSPVYFGSTGVNLAHGQSTCVTDATSCTPNFWSNFAITGPPSIGTPVGTPITAQIYSTVNAPSGAAATISWSIARTSNASSVSGITISQSGLVNVSGSVAVGSYPMTITAVDNGTSTTLQMYIYVYNATRPAPTFDTPVRTATGYTVNITNYDSDYVYTPTPDTGTVAVGTASGSILPLTLSGLSESTSATISVDSYMGTFETDVFGLKNATVRGISKWLQAPLIFANSPFVGGGGSRTLSTSGGSGTGAITYAVTTAGNAQCTITGVTTLNAASTTAGHTCGITATKAADADYVARSSANTTFTVRTLGRVPTFGTPIRTSGGYQVAITNYDALYTWNITTNRGTLSIGTPVGSTETLTITSLSPGESATITVGTTRANYSDETGTVLSFSVANLTITASTLSTTVGVTRTQSYLLSGLSGSDSVTSVSYSYSGINGTSYGPSATRPTTVGQYSVTPNTPIFGSGSAADYNINFVAGTFTINAALVVGGGSDVSTPFQTPATSSAFTVTGGTGTIVFTITGALSGVSIDSATGIVSVTANTPIRSISVNVVATDEVSASDTEPITIEVTLGSSSIILTFPTAGNYPTKKATTVVIRATVASAGRVSFTANKRKIAGCTNLRTVNFVATCSWKPTSHGYIFVLANFVPDDPNLNPASAQINTTPTERTTPR